MAIRIRTVNGVTVALCAARSMPKPRDLYLDDAMHEALAQKFFRDYANTMGTSECVSHLENLIIERDARIVEKEESNNPNRDEWDKTFVQETAV